MGRTSDGVAGGEDPRPPARIHRARHGRTGCFNEIERGSGTWLAVQVDVVPPALTVPAP
ncbi:MAG: hypothetical protein M0Z63_09210 [Actinomycetota bacterium]|jgi:hypothetical protein|nr:hypothetical protein [Actinomycetota bacterium]MDA8280579.1 hypothetical protein [Actinomycetota bacterium]